MPSDVPPILGYDSREPSALDAGEKVLWEQLVPAKFGKLETVYRITDRRVLTATARGNRTTVSAQPLSRVSLVSVEQTRGSPERTTLYVGGGVRFEGVEDVVAPHRLLLDLAPRLGRRRRPNKRWTGTPEGRVSSADAVPNSHERETLAQQPRAEAAGPANADPVLESLDLQPRERVIWTGAPSRWDRLDGRLVLRYVSIFGWALVPSGVLVVRFGHVAWGQQLPLPWIFVGLAIFWLILSAHAAFVRPFTDALRRSRTRYVLTNKRAVIVYASPRVRRVQSHFLYALTGATVDASAADGTGDVSGSFGVRFERVADAERVYAQLTEAIHAAGGPLDPAPRGGGGGDEDDPDDELD